MPLRLTVGVRLLAEWNVPEQPTGSARQLQFCDGLPTAALQGSHRLLKVWVKLRRDMSHERNLPGPITGGHVSAPCWPTSTTETVKEEADISMHYKKSKSNHLTGSFCLLKTCEIRQIGSLPRKPWGLRGQCRLLVARLTDSEGCGLVNVVLIREWLLNQLIYI